jgi:hypothetical protein
MVLAKGHSARWPLTSLHSSKSWTHSGLRRWMTASAGGPDHLPGLDRGRAHGGDRRRSRSAHRGPCCPAQRASAQAVGGPGRSSPACWSAAGGSTRPCSRWSWRPICMGSRPARSTTWSVPWAPTAASPSPRSPGSAPTWTVRSQRSGTGPWPGRAPLGVRGRHLLQGQGQPPGRRPGGGGGHRGCGDGPTRVVDALGRGAGLLRGLVGPVGSQIGGLAEGLQHAGLVGLAGAGDVEGGAVVDAGADHGQADGDVHS